MAYGQILPKRLLEMPTLACLNLHASILPRHRGAAPIQASILAGDRLTGLTVMYVAEGLDTGDVLLTRSVAIARRETAGSLHDRLAALGPEALASALELILYMQSAQNSAGRFKGDLRSEARTRIRPDRLVSGLLASGSLNSRDGPVAWCLYARTNLRGFGEEAQSPSGFADPSSTRKPGVVNRIVNRGVSLPAGKEHFCYRSFSSKANAE